MTVSKPNNGRTPLTPEALRKVRGGQGDSSRDRPDVAILIEQSIVADDGGMDPSDAHQNEIAAAAALLAEQSEVASPAVEVGDQMAEKLIPDLEQPELVLETVDTQVSANIDGVGAPVPAGSTSEIEALISKLEAETDIKGLESAETASTASEDAAKSSNAAIANEAPTAAEAGSGDSDASESTAESMSDAPMPNVDAAAKAAAVSAEADTLVSKAEVEVARGQAADKTPGKIAIEALIKTNVAPNMRNLPADAKQDLGSSGALDYEPRVENARKVDAEGRVLAKQYEAAKAKHGATSKEALAVAELLSKKVIERQAALLPDGYKPYSRTHAVDPWTARSEAADRLSNALKSGTPAEKIAAQKQYDATKIPEDGAMRDRWFKSEQKRADFAVKATLLKIERVDAKMVGLTNGYNDIEGRLIKHAREQSNTLNNHYKDMRHMTEEARDYFMPKVRTFDVLHKEYRDAKLHVDMAKAYRVALLTDLKNAELDVARANEFVSANQQSGLKVEKDMKSAGQSVVRAEDAVQQKTKVAADAVRESNEAAGKAKAIADSGDAAMKGFTDKRAGYAKLDAAADKRVKALEQVQKEMKEGGRFHKDTASLDADIKFIKYHQDRLGMAAKGTADARLQLTAALDNLPDRWDWSDANGLTRFRASVDWVMSSLELYRVNSAEYVKSAQALAQHKEQFEFRTLAMNKVSEQIDLARLPPEVAVKVAEAKHKEALVKKDESNARVKLLDEKIAATGKMSQQAWDKLSQSANILRTAASGTFDKAHIKRGEVTVSDIWLESQMANRMAGKAYSEKVAYVNSDECRAIDAKVKQAKDNLDEALKWRAESQAQASRETPQIKQAKAELDRAWTTVQEAGGKTRAAVEAEQKAARIVFETANDAQRALFDLKLARNAEKDLEIRQLKAFDKLRAEAGDGKVPAAKVEAYPKAVDTLKQRLAMLDAAKDAADLRASAELRGLPGNGAGDATRASMKDLLAKLRPDTKLAGPDKGKIAGEISKDGGSELKIQPWAAPYAKAVADAQKQGKPAPSLADFKAQTQSADFEKLKGLAISKSRELATSLAGDIAQDLLRRYAEKNGTSVKLGGEHMLAGQQVQLKLLNGTLVVEAAAQISMKTKVEAHLSNLGAYGAAGLGLKADVGALMSLKTPIGKGAAFIGDGRAYAGAGVDLDANGRVNVLGLAAEAVAKATMTGEISGSAGLALGEHFKMTAGGNAIVEGSATAKAGAKLGIDGVNAKASAAAEASARASYVHQATFADASFKSAGEVWAKAKAEATASIAADLGGGDFKLGGKLGASAGAGVGIQDVKQVKVLGIGFESAIGVHAGTIGGAVGADLGFKDGVLKWSIDVGAALGVGVTLKLGGSVDFGAMVTSATDTLTKFIALFNEGAAQSLRVEVLKLRMATGEKVWS